MPILERLADAHRTQGAGTAVGLILAPLLMSEATDQVRLHSGYSRLLALSGEALEEIEACFDDDTLPPDERKRAREIASAPMRNVQAVLAGNSVLSTVSAFSGLQIGELRILAVATRQRLGRESMTTEQLGELRQAIGDLRSAITTSALPDTLKAHLLTILRELERALDEYEVFGVEAVASQYGRLVATVAAARTDLSPEKQPQIWESLNRLATFLTFLEWGATYGPALLQSATLLLKQ